MAWMLTERDDAWVDLKRTHCSNVVWSKARTVRPSLGL